MARDLSIDQMRQMANPGRQYLWEMFIPNMPGGGDTEFMRLHVRNVQIPGLTIEPIEINWQAHKIKVSGRAPFIQTFTFQVEESEEGKAIDALIAWRALVIEPVTGLGTPELIYKTMIRLSLLKTTGEVYKAVDVIGCWPQEVADIPLDYMASETIKIDVTMSYDYWIPKIL